MSQLKVGDKAPDFILTGNNLEDIKLADFSGKKVIISVVPSLDTPTCSISTKKFNQEIDKLNNTIVLTVSVDLPFAQKRFCGAEGLENVINLSDFNTGAFGKDYGLEITDGPLAGLHSRVVIVLDENGTIVHTEQVAEIADEPNYDAALAAL